MKLAVFVTSGALMRAAAVHVDASALPPSQTAAPVAQPTDLQHWQAAFDRKVFRTSSGHVLPYRVARPASTSPRPLVLVLHGSGAMGSDNERQLGPFAASWAQPDIISVDPPIIVVPQVSKRSADYILCEGSPCVSSPGSSFASLLELLDAFAGSSEVDARRIYIVGFSMGGSAALQLALARPQLIDGVVVFAPVPPPISRAIDLKDLPLFVVHGSRDVENPLGVMRNWVGGLTAMGGRATLSIREGMQHQIPDDMLTDVRWRRRLLDGRL